MNEYIGKKLKCRACGTEQTVFYMGPGRKYPECEICSESLGPYRKKSQKDVEAGSQRVIKKAKKISAEKNIPFGEAKEQALRELKKESLLKREPKIKAFGEEKTASEWIQDPRCPYTSKNTLYSRLRALNWDPEKAIKTPLFPRKRRPGL